MTAYRSMRAFLSKQQRIAVSSFSQCESVAVTAENQRVTVIGACKAATAVHLRCKLLVAFAGRLQDGDAALPAK
jgi:predicted lipid carrier protein YhbT